MAIQNIVFIGRLLEPPMTAPRCGAIMVAVAFKFAVQKVEKGSLKGKVAVVLVPCPEFKGEKFFTTNSDYRIEASTDLQEAGSYSIHNKYSKSKLLWCVEITKV